MTRLCKLGEISDNFFLNITVKYQNIVQFEINGFLNMTFKQQNMTYWELAYWDITYHLLTALINSSFQTKRA